MSRALNITKPHWRCRCGCVAFPLDDETSCDCADVYEQDWTLIEPTIPTGDELTRLRAENTRLREALNRNLQGFSNLLEVRRILGSDRCGALTREEIEQEMGLIEAALAGEEQENG